MNHYATPWEELEERLESAHVVGERRKPPRRYSPRHDRPRRKSSLGQRGIQFRRHKPSGV